MRSSHLQLWKTIAPIFIMLGYLPTVCGNAGPLASPPPPLPGIGNTCDENSPIDLTGVPKQRGNHKTQGDKGATNDCDNKVKTNKNPTVDFDEKIYFCESVTEPSVLEPTPSCSPRCVTHARTRTGTHAHAHAHVHANKALQPVSMPCVARPNGSWDDYSPGVSAVPNGLYGR